MEIRFRPTGSNICGDLIVVSGNATIMEDIVIACRADDSVIENIFEIGFELLNFNRVNLAEYIADVISQNFTSREVEQLIEILRPTEDE